MWCGEAQVGGALESKWVAASPPVASTRLLPHFDARQLEELENRGSAAGDAPELPDFQVEKAHQVVSVVMPEAWEGVVLLVRSRGRKSGLRFSRHE